MYRTFENYVNSIQDGSIKTYDINKTIQDISSLISSYNIDFNVCKKINNTIEITLNDINKVSDFIQKYDIIEESMYNLYGWFPSKVKVIGIFGNSREYTYKKEHIYFRLRDKSTAIITFESKYDIKVNNIPNKMYHLTIQQYEKDISKGIICKNKSKLTKHDGRIYLCDNLNSCKFLINKMKFHYSQEKIDILDNPFNSGKKYNKNTNWIIFEIDTKLAGIEKLYKDPNYRDGYYYIDNINRKSIKVIDRE